MPLKHDIRNPYTFKWDYGTENVTVSMDFDDLIRDTVRQLTEMEEQARLRIVVQFLREKGYYILEPDGRNK